MHSIDFHSHYIAPAWRAAPPPHPTAALGDAWPLLSDLQAQLAALAGASIDGKVLTAPPSLLAAPGEALPLAAQRRVNDDLAALVAAHPSRLRALATVDAFGGEGVASEVERAVARLGLGGAVIDCSRGDLLLDAPEARPTLEAAAALGAPIFVHPINPPWLSGRLTRLGHTGTLLARGTETAASVLALLRAGVLDELPTLTLVLPWIAGAALLFAGVVDGERVREEGWRGSSPAQLRRRLYVDTMGLDPAAIRFAVELLGSDHVLFGSDWPIMPLARGAQAQAALSAAGLSTAQQAAIMGDITLRLLKG